MCTVRCEASIHRIYSFDYDFKIWLFISANYCPKIVRLKFTYSRNFQANGWRWKTLILRNNYPKTRKKIEHVMLVDLAQKWFKPQRTWCTSRKIQRSTLFACDSLGFKSNGLFTWKSYNHASCCDTFQQELSAPKPGNHTIDWEYEKTNRNFMVEQLVSWILVFNHAIMIRTFLSKTTNCIVKLERNSRWFWWRKWNARSV
jgi:hypothetical protein